MPFESSIYRVFLLPDWLEVDIAFTPAADFRPRGAKWRTVFGEFSFRGIERYLLRMGSPTGFSYEIRADEVVIHHHGRHAATLRGQAASDFLVDVTDFDDNRLQEVMARLTGNYKRGNERRARQHPRNR